MSSLKEIKAFLKELNLLEKEIEAYLFCLKNGPSPASSVAKKIEITRTNVYDVIKKLEEKGFVHSVGSSYGRKIKAHKPEEIQKIIEQRIRTSRKLEDKLQKLLPLFETMTDSSPSPFSKTTYYEGAENVRKMLWKSVQANSKTIFSAGSELDIKNALGKDFLEEHHLYRTKFGVTLKALRPGKKRVSGKIFQNDKKYLREMRLRPEKSVRLKSNLLIWDNYIAFFSVKEKQVFGTLIENEALSIMLSSWFEVIWEQSEPIKSTYSIEAKNA